jgi:hypothetical protein
LSKIGQIAGVPKKAALSDRAPRTPVDARRRTRLIEARPLGKAGDGKRRVALVMDRAGNRFCLAAQSSTSGFGATEPPGNCIRSITHRGAGRS